MGTLLGLLIIGAFLVGASKYVGWLRSGIRPRRITTSLTPAELAEFFQSAVVVGGWKLVQDGNPQVARSPRYAGLTGALFPQEIRLETFGADEERRVAVIAPHKVTETWTGLPRRAHTLRAKLNRFAHQVALADPTATIESVTGSHVWADSLSEQAFRAERELHGQSAAPVVQGEYGFLFHCFREVASPDENRDAICFLVGLDCGHMDAASFSRATATAAGKKRRDSIVFYDDHALLVRAPPVEDAPVADLLRAALMGVAGRAAELIPHERVRRDDVAEIAVGDEPPDGLGRLDGKQRFLRIMLRDGREIAYWIDDEVMEAAKGDLARALARYQGRQAPEGARAENAGVTLASLVEIFDLIETSRQARRRRQTLIASCAIALLALFDAFTAPAWVVLMLIAGGYALYLQRGGKIVLWLPLKRHASERALGAVAARSPEASSTVGAAD